MNYKKTVDHVDIKKFMGKWYVLGGRTTFLEKGAHNSIEIYSWNEKKERIDIDFRFQKDKFGGETKTIPQKAWIYNKQTNAHWKVSPFWPLKFDYLVVALDQVNYSWVAIGVPAGDKLWIMAREWENSKEVIAKVKDQLDLVGYPSKGIEIIEHNGDYPH